MVVQVVGGRDTGAIEELLPNDAVVEYRSATFSQRQLDAARKSLETLVPRSIVLLAVDPKVNRVRVTPVPGHEAAVIEAAGPHSKAVSLVKDSPPVAAACTSRSACNLPWRGGTQVSGCTWGFNARPATTSSARYLITAGHCALLGAHLSHNGSVVTVAPGVDDNTFDKIGTQHSDSLSAPLKTDSGARNLIYINSTSTSYAITSTKSGYSQYVGEFLCASVAYSSGSGFKCGNIELEGISMTLSRAKDGKAQRFDAMTRASFGIIGGDSGAPVIDGNLPQAFGIVSAGSLDGLDMFYSPIDYVTTDLALRLCLNSSCS